MRCEASELCVGSAEREAIGIAAVELLADPTSAIAAVAAIAQLAKRSTRRFVEEVERACVDRDRDVVAELQLDVRRERRDKIRPGSDDALLVVGRGGERLVDYGRLAANLARV